MTQKIMTQEEFESLERQREYKRSEMVNDLHESAHELVLLQLSTAKKMLKTKMKSADKIALLKINTGFIAMSVSTPAKEPVPAKELLGDGVAIKNSEE